MEAPDRLRSIPARESSGSSTQPFDPDRLDLYLRGRSSGGSATYGVLLGLVALSTAALPIVQVPISVPAAGFLRARADPQTVVVSVSGWARKVRSSEVRSVARGDTLLLLDRPDLRAREEALGARDANLRTEIADLRALIAHAEALEEAPRPISLRYGEELSRVQVELERHATRLEAARRETARAAALTNRGLAPLADLEGLRDRVRDLWREGALLRAESVTRWRRELAVATEEREALLADMAGIRQERERLAVLSPVSGEVDAMSAFSPGTFIGAGAQVATITPTSELIAELYLEPEDLSVVSPGARANLRLSSFRYSRWGGIRGRVYQIAPHAVRASEEVVGWARVRLDAGSVASPGGRIELRRGLAVSARIPAGRRSLLSLIAGELAGSVPDRAPASIPEPSPG